MLAACAAYLLLLAVYSDRRQSLFILINDNLGGVQALHAAQDTRGGHGLGKVRLRRDIDAFQSPTSAFRLFSSALFAFPPNRFSAHSRPPRVMGSASSWTATTKFQYVNRPLSPSGLRYPVDNCTPCAILRLKKRFKAEGFPIFQLSSLVLATRQRCCATCRLHLTYLKRMWL